LCFDDNRGAPARRVAAPTVEACYKEHTMHSSHAAALQSKHEGLEQRIREEMTRPQPDEALIHDLKKRKLMIKDELSSD
jgi:hypothetical protein